MKFFVVKGTAKSEEKNDSPRLTLSKINSTFDLYLLLFFSPWSLTLRALERLIRDFCLKQPKQLLRIEYLDSVKGKLCIIKFNMTDCEQAYLNSYRLLVGETTYVELSEKGSFLLPKNHEDPTVTLRYYEILEDYEKCSEILKQ